MKKLHVPPLNLEYDNNFFLFKDGKKIMPDIRTVGQMPEVIMDKAFLKNADMNTKLYFMYRAVMDAEHAPVFRRHNIRYDVTIVPALSLGIEPNKTTGHYHPLANKLAYPEIYEVIEGEAHYLLQNEAVTDVIMVKARAGDKVIMPPGYGHITINPGPGTLVMANLISPSFSSLYGPIKEKGGGAYFEHKDGIFIKNERYGKLPELRVLNARKINGMGDNLYRLFIESPVMFEFINKPELTSDILITA